MRNGFEGDPMRRPSRHRGLQALLTGIVILVVVLLFTDSTPRGCVGPTVPVAEASPIIDRRALPSEPELLAPPEVEKPRPEPEPDETGRGGGGRDQIEVPTNGARPVVEPSEPPTIPTPATPTRLIKIDKDSRALRRYLRQGDAFGTSVAEIDDLDGDGIRELAVGAPGSLATRAGSGAVWILFLDEDEEVRYANYVHPSAFDAYDPSVRALFFGAAMCSVGDLDGDSRGELAVGRLVFEAGVPMPKVEILLLSLDSYGAVTVARKTSLEAAPRLSEGLNRHSLLALAAPVGASGTPASSPSILVGFTDGPVGAERYVLDEAGTATPKDRFPPLTDSHSLRGFGRSVLSVVSAGGLGFDTYVGFLDDRDGGVARRTPSRPDGERLLLPRAKELRDRGFGSSLAWLGDRNEDGHPELAVGFIERRRGLDASGGIWILSLDPFEFRALDATTLVPGKDGLKGKLRRGDLFGWSLARLEDRSGDGRADLAVGAPGDDETGAVYLVLFGESLDDQRARRLEELGYGK